MTQYDAGPGDWSDRPWEDPQKKESPPQARRPRLKLPPWALLALLVGIIILLCVGLVLIVQALRGGEEEATATQPPTRTAEVMPTNTLTLFTEAPVVTPTDTVVLPVETSPAGETPTEIETGAQVIVQGTAGVGLNLRAEPSTQGRVVANAREGTELTVLEGPQEADGYVWWNVRTPDGREGWGAARWLALKTQ
jgi:hypothetical protein